MSNDNLNGQLAEATDQLFVGMLDVSSSCNQHAKMEMLIEDSLKFLLCFVQQVSGSSKEWN